MESVTVPETLAIFSTAYFPRRLAWFTHNEGFKSRSVSTVLSHTLKFLIFSVQSRNNTTAWCDVGSNNNGFFEFNRGHPVV
jgi:hypothetical protein